jgi:hypothetical protein
VVSNSDGSADWVVIIWLVAMFLAFTGGLTTCLGDTTNVPPGERPCVEQMTNAAC